MAASSAAMSWTLEDLEASFHPHADGVPTFPGYEPGMVIDQSNVDQFKELFDEAMYQHIKDGWTTVKTAPTRPYPLGETYIEATRVAIDDQPDILANKQVTPNYKAGRAFPYELTLDDPMAGTKAAWNYLWGYNWGDNACICPFYWDYKDASTDEGKIERSIKWEFRILAWMHRTQYEPIPQVATNPSQYFRSIVSQAYEPFDLKNTQLLLQRYKDDTRRTDAWLYLGFQRRVRRLATGQITDAFLGTDLMIEDFEGYEGRIYDYKWKLIEKKAVFLPFHHRNELDLADERVEQDGFQFIDFDGKGKCFPKTTYELREVYVVEASPEEEGHPLSKRIMYFDAETFTIPRSVIFDQKGAPWKSFSICQAHSDTYGIASNVGTGVPIDDCFMSFDLQAQHCTTGQFKGIIGPEKTPLSDFNVQAMRKKGR